MRSVVGIVQARLTSSRLPNKVLKSVCGRTILEHVVSRAKLSKKIDTVLVAIPDTSGNDALATFCHDKHFEFIRGSETNVLARYLEAAESVDAKTIVRITADCPLIDPAVIDDCIDLFDKSKVDYAANTVPPEKSHWPDGSDVEVFTLASLKRAHQMQLSLKELEHVTHQFWQRQDFSSVQLDRTEDASGYRFTLDHIEDLYVIKHIFEHIERNNILGTVDQVVEFLSKNPEIRAFNSKFKFGAGW